MACMSFATLAVAVAAAAVAAAADQGSLMGMRCKRLIIG